MAISISKYHHKQSDESGSSQSPERAEPVPKKIARRCFVDDPLLITSLDRTQTTHALMAAVVDVSKLTLCRASFDSVRSNGRVVIAQAIRENFDLDVPLVAHFDGKLLPNRHNENSERMPILTSGKGSKSCSAFQNINLPPERRWATLSSSFCGIWRALASTWQVSALTQHQTTLAPTQWPSL